MSSVLRETIAMRRGESLPALSAANALLVKPGNEVTEREKRIAIHPALLIVFSLKKNPG